MTKTLKKQKAFPYLTTDEMKEMKSVLKSLYADKETKVFKSQIFISLLEKYFTNKDSKVLDLGSANGQVFNTLKDLAVKHTYGSDINNYLSKGMPTEGFNTFDFNKDSFPYPEFFFDVLISAEVVEHLENPYHFLREAHRILKPGGIFILTTPNPSHIHNKLLFLFREQFYRFLEGNDHITFLTDPIIKKGILKHFELVETQYIFPEMSWRFLGRFKYPANRHFGRGVIYILRNK